MTFSALLSSSLTFLVVFCGTRNMGLSIVGGLFAFIVLWFLSILRPCKCPRCLGVKHHFEDLRGKGENGPSGETYRTTSRRGERCSEVEARHVQKLGTCPDCLEILYGGPGGSGAQNAFCRACGSGFNDLGMFGVERITDRRAGVGKKQPEGAR